MFERSPMAASSSGKAEASFSAASDSPVREDSSTASPVASTRRASAATRSPVLRTRTSPGTTSAVSISMREPTRSTRHVGLLRSASASRARSAPRSCVTASTMFSTMMATITSGSRNPEPSRAASAKDSAAATRRMMFDTSLNWRRTWDARLSPFACR